uniref:Uncharacterized protein n=1 Tax=Oncorhynchus tshawytscha TaxID=74940 RepID=A0AAZ3SS50_ONCTS
MLWTVSLCLLLAASSSGVPLDRYSTKGQHKVLLVSFDGFRWDYDRDVDTPKLDTMAKDRVKARYVTPPYLTITSPTHFTLLTGTYWPEGWLSSLSWHAIHLPGRDADSEGSGTTVL